MSVQFNREKIMQRLRVAVSQAIAKSAIELQAAVKAKLNLHASNIGNGGIAAPAGGPPGNRTGSLSRSIQAKDITAEPLKPTWRVGTNMVYARIQEMGGRVRPKKGKFLPVPIGVDGMRAMARAKGNLRSLDLTLLRTKAGKLLLGKWKGTKRSQTFQPLIILVKEVYLPARPYMRPAYNESKGVTAGNVAVAISKAMKVEGF